MKQKELSQILQESMLFRNIWKLNFIPGLAQWQLHSDDVQTELLRGLIMKTCSSWNRTKTGIVHLFDCQLHCF